MGPLCDPVTAIPLYLLQQTTTALIMGSRILCWLLSHTGPATPFSHHSYAKCLREDNELKNKHTFTQDGTLIENTENEEMTLSKL